MAYFGIDEEFGPEVEQAFENFISDITQLVSMYGYSNVERALKVHFALFDASLPEISALSGVNESAKGMGIKAGISKAKELGNRAVDAIKDTFRTGGKRTAGRAGQQAGKRTLAGVAGGTAALAGKEAVDYLMGPEEVVIAGIETNDSLKISPSLEFEDLMNRTTAAIDNMTQLLLQTQKDLGKGIAGVDAGLEDVVAASTGETPAQVDTRQDLGIDAPPKKTAAAPADKKSNKDSKKKS